MTGFVSMGGGGPDYIQPGEPSNPQDGELWFDTDGGSDGSGELKIYDTTDGVWEVTGFTAHGDLTGVTRDAHHPPVDVSEPLTQPTDQSLGLNVSEPLTGGSSLGLSIGDGLADSGGTLVADLGNGLGIDGSGQVYVPAGAMAHGAEVDAPSDAHHVRYSDAEASAASPVQNVNGQTGAVNIDTAPSSELVSVSASLINKGSGTYSDSESHTSAAGYVIVYARVYVNSSRSDNTAIATLDAGGWEVSLTANNQSISRNTDDVVRGNVGATTGISASVSMDNDIDIGNDDAKVEVAAFALDS